MARFKVDENLPVEVAHVLQSDGHDASTIHHQKLVGESDALISQVCNGENRAILTLDLDFADIRNYVPADFCGIIVLRLLRQDKMHVLSVVQRLLPTIQREDLDGKLWIVDESSVRIRS